MNIQRKIMLYAIIAALSIIVFNRIDGVLKSAYSLENSYQSVEELDAAYEQEQRFRNEFEIIEMRPRWIELDPEFFQVTSILGIGMIASIMLRLRE